MEDIAFWIVLLLAGIACLWPFHLGQFERAYLSDDFYYYVQVAKNLAETGRSTFDGIHLTNGYHPLWLVILTVFWKVAGSSGFFWLVNVTIVVSTAAVFGLTRTLLHNAKVSEEAGRLASLWSSLFFLYFSRTGMEVVLTVPLMLCLLLRWQKRTVIAGWKTVAVDGLLASALVLSRLDSSLLLALIGAIYFVGGEGRLYVRFRYIAGAAVWLWPVVLYAISNRVLFGTFGTVSGLTKHLRFSHVPSKLALVSMANLGPGVMGFVVVAFVLGSVGIGFLWMRRGAGLRRDEVAVLAAVIVFPFGYYLLLSISSGWRIFSWYDYPLIFSSIAGIIVLQASFGGESKGSKRAQLGVECVVRIFGCCFRNGAA